jgi:drug/metabolite transporter (DMT)-like permease
MRQRNASVGVSRSIAARASGERRKRGSRTLRGLAGAARGLVAAAGVLLFLTPHAAGWGALLLLAAAVAFALNTPAARADRRRRREAR